MLVVDTSVWIASFRGARTDAVRKLQAYDLRDGLLIGDLILLELLQGARSDQDAIQIERRLRSFPSCQCLTPTLQWKLPPITDTCVA